MKRRISGSFPSLLIRFGAAALLIVAAFAAAGCEQALQVAPESSTISLTSSAANVPLNGSLLITVTATTSAGKAVPDGTLVTFATTLGTLSAQEAHLGNGRATVTLLAGDVAGTATITVTSGGVSAPALSVRVGPVPSRIILSASSSALGSVSILATVFDSSGIAIPGSAVTFTTSAGTLATTTAYADMLGQAYTTLYTTTDAVVTAESLGVRSTIAVRGTSGTGGSISVNLGVNPSTPLRNQTVTFTATVAGYNGATVPVEHYEWYWDDGTVVTTTGNIVTKAFGVEGIYGLTVKVFGYDGSVGISRVQFYVD